MALKLKIARRRLVADRLVAGQAGGRRLLVASGCYVVASKFVPDPCY